MSEKEDRRKFLKKAVVFGAIAGPSLAAGDLIGARRALASSPNPTVGADPTFSADGVQVPSLAADPASPVAGQVWFRNDLGQLRVQSNTSAYSVGSKPYVTVTPQGPDDGGDYGPNTPGTTTDGINEAITDAKSGSTVFVTAGSYTIDSMIVANKAITLIFDTDAVLTYSSSLSFGIGINSDNVHIYSGQHGGLAAAPSSGGLAYITDNYLQPISSNFKGIVISGCIFNNFNGVKGTSAISIQHSDSAVIENNQVLANNVAGSYGILLVAYSTSYYPINCVVRKNYVEKTVNDAIFVQYANSQRVQGTRITENTVYDSGDGAIENQGEGTIITLNSVLADALTTYAQHGYIACTSGALDSTISNNLLINSFGIEFFSVSGTPCADGVNCTNNMLVNCYYGLIAIQSVNNFQASGNAIIGTANAYSSSKAALLITGGSNIRLLNNLVKNAYAAGLQVYAYSNISGLTVANNQVINSSQTSAGTYNGIDIQSNASNSSTITNAEIYGNSAIDDQGTHTQKIGIRLSNGGLAGSLLLVSLHDNLSTGNSSSDYDFFYLNSSDTVTILHNTGTAYFTKSTATLPTSGSAFPALPYDAIYIITTSTGLSALTLNGTAVSTTANIPIFVPAGEAWLVPTYTGTPVFEIQPL